MKEQRASGQTEPVVSVSEIRALIEGYRKQLEYTDQQLRALEQNYLQQREQGLQSVHQLAGAISALEALLPEAPKTE